MSTVTISSRHGVASEYAELEAFVAALEEADLTMFVSSADYDSNSQCCEITTLMDVRQDEDVGEQLLAIATSTISQFLLFEVVHHGRGAGGR